MQVYAYRNPVLFLEASEAIPANALLVEIGPHAVLRSLLRGTRPELAYISTMTKGSDGQETLATAVGDMWRAGVPVHWSAPPVPLISEGTEGECTRHVCRHVWATCWQVLCMQ